MKPILLILVLLFMLLPGSVFAMSLPDTLFIGTASLADGRLFTYKLRINDSAGVLSGYSVMDVNGTQETRATITGTLSQSGNQIQFQETAIENSKYKEKTGFCILQGSLKIKHFNGTLVLKGHFEGYLDNSTTLCASGKLILISPKDAFKILNKSEDKIDSGSEKDPVTETEIGHQSSKIAKVPPTALPATQPIVSSKDPTPSPKKDTATNPKIIYEAPPEHVLTVSPGKTINIECPAGVTTFEIWDNKDIDGDIITLMQGNTALIKNLTLTSTHYPIVLSLKPGQTKTLRLIAVSEGTEPLNTARIRITSGNTATFIDATSTIDKEVLIVVRGK